MVTGITGDLYDGDGDGCRGVKALTSLVALSEIMRAVWETPEEKNLTKFVRDDMMVL